MKQKTLFGKIILYLFIEQYFREMGVEFMDNKKYELFYQSIFSGLGFETDEFPDLKITAGNVSNELISYGQKLARSFGKIADHSKSYGLADIFNNFGVEPTKRTIIQKRFPSQECSFIEGEAKIAKSDREQRFNDLKLGLQKLNKTEQSFYKALNLLQDNCSFLPANIGDERSLDISLYEYIKLTIAFTQALDQYMNEVRINFDEEKLNKAEALILVSFDISGIQSFIYKITTKGAYKQLRSRSFYLDMISEWMSDSLLHSCGLTRANLIYSGGGHAYLILPNTKIVTEKIGSVERKFNDFFLKKFGIDLYVAFGYEPFKPLDIKRGNTVDYRHIYRNLSRKLSDKKLHRYTTADISRLNIAGKRTGRECKVCHSVDELTKEGLCQLCLQLQNFSNNIQKDDYFVINREPLNGLAVSNEHYLHKISQNNVVTENYVGVLYAKNKFGEGDGAIRIMAGDHAATDRNELSYYVERDKGLRKIAALRCDADDLGYAFMAGFSKQNGGIYNTFARSAEFSHNLSMFFKYHINTLAKGKKLMIIYSGGDDVFLLGAWDDVLAFAVELRTKFREWTNEKLTLSSGIALFDATIPINIVARETGALEDVAKDNGKDSICVFNERFTYKYDDFIENIYQGKLPIIRNFFEIQGERGNSFVYKLLDLIRERRNGKQITFARMAYYLTRLEDIISRSKYDDKESQVSFNEFKRNMITWFKDDAEVSEVELALILYVYENRKES